VSSRLSLALILAAVISFPIAGRAADTAKSEPKSESKPEAPAASLNQYAEERHESHGSAMLGGKRIEYTAVGGTLMIEDSKNEPGAMMSYVAYLRTGAGAAADRPIVFLYNGGPGSSTLWLHMGAFGPKRVVVGDALRGPPAPYPLVDNADSPLDVADLVFVDAPGTGFGRVGVDLEKVPAEDNKREEARKKNDELTKDFYGVDQDARAFDIFITKFLTRFSRWNSPRFLFGESYGTTRSAALSAVLKAHSDIDLNGVMLLSQILNFDLSDDGPQDDPGNDMPYVMSLPTYAATAWYHKRLQSAPQDLEAFVTQVEQFAVSDYQSALMAGDRLSTQERHAVAERLHDFIGLPVEYLEKANLRVNGGMFEKTLLEDQGLTIGRLDTRYTSPTLDLLSKEAEYDPQSAAIDSAFVSTYNEYARATLGFPRDERYEPEMDLWTKWDWKHKEPGDPEANPFAVNVMPDLALVMKTDPQLKVALFSGYYDLATPFFEGQYELNHLGLPPEVRKNIEIHHFSAGHMVYVSPEALKQLHDQFAAFVTARALPRVR
jgi:carboxypeptidase C (cathepsin A)